MGKITFIILSQFLLIILQLGLGNIGWPLPLALLGALYATLALGLNWGCAAALFSGTILSALYGGGVNIMLVFLHPLLAAALNWWVERHDEDIRPDFFLPGVWAGLVSAIPAASSIIFHGVLDRTLPEDLPFFLLRMLWTAVVSGGIFMGVIFLGESCTEFMGLPRFFTRKGGHKR